ncbi:SPFH domain-containing protein [Microbacterium sp.]|uniref:SPFH domain-containing protein n=1 Tax=Microbacterium sp. TaxID=51671 RepID=UPI0039E6549A
MSTDTHVTPGAGRALVNVEERPAWRINGFALAVVALLLIVGGVAMFLVFGTSSKTSELAAWGLVPLIVGLLLAAMLVIVAPNEARVIEFFGRYVGTVRTAGLSAVVPFALRRRVSLRVRNFETSTLKVNDAVGNPIEVAAIVVWQVWDAAKAVYAVDDYEQFVAIQSESGLRHIATSHPYDTGSETSLRGSTDVVAAELADEISQRTAMAGVQVVEVRISHLAYAPEIAQAMLRKQQAAAVVAARALIVEGAVGMVETALRSLGEKEIVDLDEERKASMVSNLMVVLCSDQPASPIVNTGTLYS